MYFGTLKRTQYDNERTQYDNERTQYDNERTQYDNERTQYDNERTQYDNERTQYDNERPKIDIMQTIQVLSKKQFVHMLSMNWLLQLQVNSCILKSHNTT